MTTHPDTPHVAVAAAGAFHLRTRSTEVLVIGLDAAVQRMRCGLGAPRELWLLSYAATEAGRELLRRGAWSAVARYAEPSR